MFKQLVLPLIYSEPTDFACVKVTTTNSQAITWLKNWNDRLDVNFVCLVGSQAILFASIWGIENQACHLSNGQRLIEDWYSLIEQKHKSKCYVMTNPEFIEEEEVFLYVINFIKERCFRLLLASVMSTDRWNITLPDLKSRVSTMNVINC